MKKFTSALALCLGLSVAAPGLVPVTAAAQTPSMPIRKHPECGEGKGLIGKVTASATRNGVDVPAGEPFQVGDQVVYLLEFTNLEDEEIYLIADLYIDGKEDSYWAGNFPPNVSASEKYIFNAKETKSIAIKGVGQDSTPFVVSEQDLQAGFIHHTFELAASVSPSAVPYCSAQVESTHKVAAPPNEPEKPEVPEAPVPVPPKAPMNPEKPSTPGNAEKPADKPMVKPSAPGKADRPGKTEKPADKPGKTEKPADRPGKTEKPADKPGKTEKPADKPMDKPSAPSKAEKPGSETPVAAIVGGVLGGLALIGALVAAVFSGALNAFLPGPLRNLLAAFL
ncbi:hypothetical protein CPHO_00195 [Corynebacterium phocae]|uniref:Uncharacterized protein n=1 Tax=Corynebacterium phocae TaxID=161895 RepID=A0A1L7D0X8_9CORY|nr:hypothetical protein [Corynebacterium phocae]APT91611.1 hypothetical protein CPHO_00195 [Corynebacterium phocae]KAA8720683.1 hypothetical protein F4V58_12050 [Corynebacterium phocae]